MEVFLLVVFVAIVWVLLKLFCESALLKGREGERHVSRLLKRLPPGEYIVLNDLMLPDKDGSTTQVDHVVISRAGIFVIETKNYSGWIFGDVNWKEWTQCLRSYSGSEKFRFQNPIRQNWRHIYVMAEALKLPQIFFKNVVVFGEEVTFKTYLPENVLYFNELINYITSFQECSFNLGQMKNLEQRLLAIDAEVSEEARKNHVANLRRRHELVLLQSVVGQEDVPKCPRCGSSMVLRHRRSDGAAFYGCSQYPNCRGTVNCLV